MARAFLSDSKGRKPISATWLDGSSRHEIVNGSLALIEARAILAETETVGGEMPMSCFNGRLASLRAWDDPVNPIYVTEPKAALAESLLAFVEA